ncbi:MAG: hypothetical protein ACXWZF_02130 [Actinomycetota bacterium]
MNIEDKVRDALHTRAEAVQQPDTAWTGVISQVEGLPPRCFTRVAAGMVAATVAVGLGFAFVALRPAPVDVEARREGGPPTARLESTPGAE